VLWNIDLREGLSEDEFTFTSATSDRSV